eukprot:7445529-Pyramimonas_sp.AAC.1
MCLRRISKTRTLPASNLTFRTRSPRLQSAMLGRSLDEKSQLQRALTASLARAASSHGKPEEPR